MIRLCAFPDEATSDFYEQISALKRNGISLIEFRSANGKNVSDFTVDEAKRYQDIFADNGISVWALGSPLGKVDINTDFLQYSKKIRHVCELAKIFNTDKIRMFSFFNAIDNEEKVYEYLREMVKIGSEYGVYMCHENETEIFGDVAERVSKIMQNVDGLKYVYDVANFLVLGVPAQTTLDLFHAHTEYFHIKDAILGTYDMVPAGYGDGKVEELISRITDDKVLSVEPHLAVFDASKPAQSNTQFVYQNLNQAFDVAITALKQLLIKLGYKEQQGVFVK